MLPDISVIIPSYKRAGKMKTHLLFNNPIIAVNAEEEEEYRKEYPDLELLILPDTVKGNMAKVRNHIKRSCKTKYLIMCDDDITHFQTSIKNKKVVMNKEQVELMILKGFQLMEDIGTVMWGINLNTDPKCYMAYTPFNLLSPILGPFTCMIANMPCWYDERLGLKEDYDLSLQVLRKYHKIVRMNMYAYGAGHIDNITGGCTAYRTQSKELEQVLAFQKKWGSKVVKFDANKSINPRVSVPLKGI